jgi:hypothetical protein
MGTVIYATGICASFVCTGVDAPGWDIRECNDATGFQGSHGRRTCYMERMHRLQEVGRVWIGICSVSANTVDLFPPLTLTCGVCRARAWLRAEEGAQGGRECSGFSKTPAARRANHRVLSTFALSSKHLRECGWGEMRFTCPQDIIRGRNNQLYTTRKNVTVYQCIVQ